MTTRTARSQTTVPIKGRVNAQALKATLAAMPEIVRANMGDAMRTTGSEMVRNAKARVPIGTGTLRDHIDFSFSPTYCRSRVGITPGTVWIQGHVTINPKLAVDIGSKRLRSQGARAYRASHYAHMVEFGARGGAMPAQPFMGPAFEGQMGPLESRMRAAQRASLDGLANVGSSFL